MAASWGLGKKALAATMGMVGGSGGKSRLSMLMKQPSFMD